MRVNLESNASVRLQTLSTQGAQRIYHTALQILSDVGVLTHDADARQMYLDAGAHCDGERVYLPEPLVREAVAQTPERFTVHARDPARSLFIEPNRVYYGPGPTCTSFIDPTTGEHRLYVTDDAVAVAKTCDALEHIDFVESLGSISDAPADQMDVYEFARMAENTTKPIVAWSFSVDTCADIHQMAVAMAGGEEEFAKKPNYIFYAEPMSPLNAGKEALQKLIYCARNRIPMVYTPCPMAGATAPSTMAGLLAQALAESLHGLVLAQSISPGTPFIVGGVVSVMDMKTTAFAYGAPELSLASAGLTEVARSLGLPVWSTGGCTDAKTIDEQAAIEGAISVTMAALSGANLVHDVGYTDSGLTGSLPMLVMCNEIIAMVKRVVGGMDVCPEELAVEVIDAVGPGGKFLGEMHTVERCRTQAYFPDLADRRNFETWQAEGATTMGERIEDRVREILDTYEPEGLGEDVKDRFEEILQTAVARAEEAQGDAV